MSEIYFYALGSVFAVSLISLAGVFTLSLREDILRKYIFLLVSLAIGALLGDAFIHLIPESFVELDATIAGLLVIFGIFIFFVLEKFLHWHHSHGLEDEGCEEKYRQHHSADEKKLTVQPFGRMLLISDGAHNLLDGMIIGASYFVSVEVGIATTFAVILHEIPQEIGDFGVLLHAGFSKSRALLLNFFSALAAFVGALAVLLLHEVTESVISFLVPIAAGGFIYIAASDLIPELHKTKRVGQSFLQLISIALGVAAVTLIIFLE